MHSLDCRSHSPTSYLFLPIRFIFYKQISNFLLLLLPLFFLFIIERNKKIKKFLNILYDHAEKELYRPLIVFLFFVVVEKHITNLIKTSSLIYKFNEWSSKLIYRSIGRNVLFYSLSLGFERYSIELKRQSPFEIVFFK